MPPKQQRGKGNTASNYKDPMFMMSKPPAIFKGEEDEDDDFSQLQQKFNFLEGAAAAADGAGPNDSAGSDAGCSDDFDPDEFERGAGDSDDDGTGIPPHKKKDGKVSTAFHREFMDSLPQQLRRRVKALLVLDEQYQELAKEREKKRQALFQKFEFGTAAPIFLMRKALVVGAQAPSDDLVEEGYPLLHATVGVPCPTGDEDALAAMENGAAAGAADDDDDDEEDIEAIKKRRRQKEAKEKQGGKDDDDDQQKQQQQKQQSSSSSSKIPVHERGLPAFWLTALKRHLVIDSLITPRDEEILRYCIDVSVATIEPALGEGFIVRFEFALNPFFRNKALVKTFHTTDDDETGEDMVVDFTSGTRILWTAPENNVTTKIIAHKQRSGGGGGGGGRGGGGKNSSKRATRTVKKQVRVNSFFRFFFDEVTDPEDAQLEDGYDYDEVEEEQWMGLGLVLQDKLVPYAVEYYTHEATDGSSDWGADSEGDEEDEEGWMSDDEEEEEEEEVVVQPSRGGRGGGRASGSGAAAAAAVATPPAAAAAGGAHKTPQAPQPKPKTQKQSAGALSAAAKLAKAAPNSYGGSGGGGASGGGGDAKSKEDCKQQ